MRVLAIDDNPDSLSALKAVLHDAMPTCVLLSASTGDQGIDLARVEDPDVILLDPLTSGMDGFDICRRLKAEERLGDIPVVFLTALQTDRATRVRALDAGTDAFLSKPVDELELVAQIRAMTRLKAAHRLQRQDTERLEALVAGRTRALEEELAERRRLEREARGSEERLSALINSVEGIVWELDVESFQFTYVSPRAERLLGYPASRWTGERDFWSEHIHPEDRERSVRYCVECTRERRDHQFEYRMLAADGHVVWIRDIVTVMMENGRPTKLRGLMVDISDNKRAEEALRESESHFRAVTESANLAIVTADGQGRIVAWNPKAESMFGYTVAEALGKPLSLVLPDPLLGGSSPEVREVSSGTGQRVFGRIVEVEGRRKDGSVFPMELSLARWKSLEGWFVTGMMTDITERRRAKEAMRVQSAALDATASPIVLTDRAGTITWANSAFAALSGYTLEEALGRNPRDLVKSGVHDPSLYKQLWDTVLAGRVWQGELINRRKDGTLYPENMSITPVRGPRGDITHFIAIKRDLSGERAAQAQLYQSQRLESVGQLAGGVAHDFNNLLTVINGVVDLALADLRAEDPLSSDLREVREAGSRAAALTQQLLAFSRKQVMQPECLSLNGLVTEISKMLRRLIGENIDLRTPLAGNLPPVLADAGQLEQVLVNLAINARDAMPQGGTLTIGTQHVNLEESDTTRRWFMPPGSYVMLTVGDTGEGMDAATQSRIFEPFFSTKEAGRGTGLGLSTVYGIVKQSGGFILVGSEPGQGTTFTIYLPQAADTGAELRRPLPPPVETGGTETLLVVDDDVPLRAMTARVLARAGYKVLVAANGEDAVHVVGRHDGPLHLLLTDVVMPGLSGPQLAERLVPLHPRLKLLFTSGYMNDTLLRAGVAEHATQFLSKPFTIEGLMRKVREVLDS
jgi:PAS domain S-box-containing protein